MRVIQISFPFEVPVNLLPVSFQVVAIGEFDGIHLGHQKVIKRAVQIAQEMKIPSAIMTFHPHPKEVLGQGNYAEYLTPLDEKIELFASLGVDYIYVVHFNIAFSQITPAQFIKEVLVPMRIHSVIVGFDFTFGHRGVGNTDTLCQLSKGLFDVEVISPFHMNGNKVSSTLIRGQLGIGEISGVNQLLGRQYTISGVVVHGEGRGRKIGFPTANIEPNASYVIPVNGVYVVKIFIGEKTYAGVMNIGIKPTFTSGNGNRTLEVHILDFSESIYGKTVKITFISHLRNEKKFSSVDELIGQIHKDIAQSNHILLNMT